MPRKLTIVLALLGTGLGCGCGSHTPAPPVKPEPVQLENLDDETDVYGYVVCPPKGYKRLQPKGGPPGMKLTAWAGPNRADGTAPGFLVNIGTPPPGEHIPPQEELLSVMLQSRKQKRADWWQSPSKKVDVNGISFLKGEWKGTDKGRKMHGFVYVVMDGPTFIELSCQDVEPHHEEALKIGDNAARTLRRK